VCVVGYVEPLAAAAKTLALHTPHDERIVSHRCRLLEQFVQLRIVLVGGTLEPRPDQGLLGSSNVQ
jgi:hypothetical protein